MQMTDRRAENVTLYSVCALIITLSLWGTAQQLAKTYPIDMWEAGLLAESFRFANAMPVYEDARSGHATHMYGPLATSAVGMLFRVTGPSFYPARLLSLSCVLFAIVLIVWIVRPPQVRLCAVIAVALLLGFGRNLTDYVEPRPDGASLLLSLVSVVMLYRGYQQESLRWHVGGLVSLVLALLFKQPSAMVCAIPVVGALLEQPRRFTLRRVAMLLSPFVVIGGVIAVIAFQWPALFHYMIEVPLQYRIQSKQVWNWAVRFPLSMPLVWLAFALWLRSCNKVPFSDPRFCWILASVLVAMPCGIAAASKTGGMANSLVPAYFACIALFLHCSGPLEETIDRWNCGLRDGVRPLYVALLAGLLFVSFIEPRLESVRTDVSYGDPHYQQVIELARTLEGQVVCPQDPSIGIFARGWAGRSLVLEYDNAGWPKPLPDYLFDELKQARYCIALGGPGDWRCWPLSSTERDSLLKQYGFQPLHTTVLEGSVYQIWHRAETPRPNHS